MPNRIATSPATPRTTAAPLAGPSSLTVKAGDTLGKLATQLGCSVKQLVAANQGKYPSLATNANAIQVGWKLSAPGAAANTASLEGPPKPAGWNSTVAGGGAARPTGGVAKPPDFGKALSAGGAQSIEMRMKQHNDAIDRSGVGVYFGDHSDFKTMTPEQRQAWVQENTKPGATAPATQKESSCIGWAMENVGAAYKAAGKSERWEQIQRVVVSKGSKGIDLAKELQKDGWQSIYWNPDAKHPNDNNPEHSFSALQASRGNGYYGLKVDAQVTNYRPTDGQGTKQDLSGIEKLNKVPFFFGMAKGGVHTFVGRQGNVNEFHWSEMPNSQHAIQDTPLKDWGWNSGVIMVPPGTWPKE